MRNTCTIPVGSWLGAVLLVGFAASAALAQVKLTIAPHPEERRFVVAEYVLRDAKVKPPLRLKDAGSGDAVACQWESAEGGIAVRWVVPCIAANQAKTFLLEQTSESPKDGMVLKQDPSGYVSILGPDREITRYHFAGLAEKHKKPFFYPVMANGVAMTRAFPMESKEGEATDHPHHTSIYYAHGEVNGKDYWSKVPITHTRFVKKVSGPVYARIVAENAWGEDIVETQDVTILNAGPDVVMDWVITLTGGKVPAHLGKTKEGGFSVRVPTGLTAKGGGSMKDALGNVGEPAIRNEPPSVKKGKNVPPPVTQPAKPRGPSAVWADNWGQVDGKTVGVTIMNHPASWRHPTDWHVRGYGLFAANAFFLQGEQVLQPKESVTLRYRLYFHAGDPEQGKVQSVYAGYANAVVEAK